MLIKKKQNGFTLIELMIIAPIVIIAVIGTVALLINLIAENAITNAENAASAEVQNSLNEIQNSLSSSTLLWKESDIPWLALIDAETSDYAAAGPGTASEPFKGMRIIGTTHDQVVVTGVTSPAFLATPNSCDSAKRVNNAIASTYTVYFAQNVANQSKTELKRRVLTVPSPPAICNGPSIILPSCEATGATTNCSKDDILAKDVVKFNVQYCNTVSCSPAVPAINADYATSVKIDLVVKRSIGGKDITYSGSTRFDLLNKE